MRKAGVLQDGGSGAVEFSLVNNLAQLEQSLAEGLETEWSALAANDPHATFFQDAPWCLTWYRCYAEIADIRLLVGRRNHRIVALAPLARLKADNSLTWAGHSMADYRDVVAAADDRLAAIAAVTEHFLDGDYTAPFRWGFTQPASPSIALLEQMGNIGVRSLTHPCFRVDLTRAGLARTFVKKESVRRHLSYYKRLGEVVCDRVQSYDGWEAHRAHFVVHHSLRQLFARRPRSFDQPHKLKLYDELFRSHPDNIALHVLQVGSRTIAGHVGFVWRGTAYFGAPAFDVIEHRRSPGQLILALLLQDWHGAGLSEVDLTIGDSSYKARFGTDRVALLSADIHRPGSAWLLALLRHTCVSLIKRRVETLHGPKAWDNFSMSLSRMAGRMKTRHPLVKEMDRALPALPGRIVVKAAPVIPAALPDIPDGQHSASAMSAWNNLHSLLALNLGEWTLGQLLRRIVSEIDSGALWVSLQRDDELLGWAFLRVNTDAASERIRAHIYAVTVLDDDLPAGRAHLVALAHAEAVRRQASEVCDVIYGCARTPA